MGTAKVSRNSRIRVFNRDNGQCYWCGKELFLLPRRLIWTNIPIDQQATLDHIQPRVAGGGNYPENLVLACRACNNKKGDSLIHPVTGKAIEPKKIRSILGRKGSVKCGV